MAKHKLGKRSVAQAAGTETKDRSPYVMQRGKVQFPLNVKYPYEITPKQQSLIDLILDKESKVIFVNGPAGTAKTLVGAYAGLTLLRDKRVSDIIFVRSIIESATRSMGALPGLLSEKFQPFTMPLNDKLNELLPAKDIEALTKDSRIEYLPINFARGASYNVKYIMGDECQNLSVGELLTLITRLGRFSKMVLCGDQTQSDLNGKSGFMKFFDLFNDESSCAQGIHCFSFTHDDIVRNGILKYVMERVENAQIGKAHKGPELLVAPGDWTPQKVG